MEGAKEVVDAINGLRDDIDQRHIENIGAQALTDGKLVEAIRGIDELRRAFPGGDWDGHRRYHEAVIKRIEAREKFYQDLRTDLATKGLWAVIIALGGAVIFYIKAKVVP
jgi:hypothetical protein